MNPTDRSSENRDDARVAARAGESAASNRPANPRAHITDDPACWCDPTVFDGVVIHKPNPETHRCRVCGALWRLNPAQPDQYPKDHPFHRPTLTLMSERCGPCCDNAAMGGVLEPLP